MDEMMKNRMSIDRINRWFSVTYTFQIMFIAVTLVIAFPASIASLILMILMSRKTKCGTKICAFGHIVIEVLMLIFCYTVKANGMASDTGSGADRLFHIIEILMAISLVLNLDIIYLCFRAVAMTGEIEYLKQQKGYPYFIDFTSNNHLPKTIDKSDIKEMESIETGLPENDDDYVLCNGISKKKFHVKTKNKSEEESFLSGDDWKELQEKCLK